MRKKIVWILIAAVCGLGVGVVQAQEAEADEEVLPTPTPTIDEWLEDDEDHPIPIKCTMQYAMKSWSVFYKSGKGKGVIQCDNGQTARVFLSSKGGGITAGKGEIRKGKGSFSEVHDISELFGGYAVAEASAGAGKLADAQVVTKGEISLALSGIGSGVGLGFSFGKFTITPAD